jgi:hypothetical protein
MAILRSMDGKFYNIPDDQLEQHLVPAEELKNHLGAEGPGGQPGADAGLVTPQGCWRNCWRNCWSRNCWRNCY